MSVIGDVKVNKMNDDQINTVSRFRNDNEPVIEGDFIEYSFADILLSVSFFNMYVRICALNTIKCVGLFFSYICLFA